MKLPGGQHLVYCTNVHPYEDVPGLLAALREFAAPLRERLGLERLGVGLWFPAPVAREVARDPAALVGALERLGLEVVTLNAFPQGSFHGRVVKDAVFRPAWSERERLEYTLVAAEALAALLPPGEVGSISTHSGAYKPWGAAANDPASLAAGFLAAASGLARLERRTGRRIVLALEPEPLSTLETTEEVLAFFGEHLLPGGEAARRHLGLCYDACHQAVEFEDMAASVAALREAGIALGKVQLSSAIRVPRPDLHRERLRPFAEDRWFHQVVVARAGGRLERVADLPAALADERLHGPDEWRVHYHVPLFADPLDDEGRLRTTRPWLEQLLALVGGRPDVTPHLEIETYTFLAIPEGRRAALGAVTLLDALEQEFRWVLGRLGVGAGVG